MSAWRSSGRPAPGSRRWQSWWHGSTTRARGAVSMGGVDLRDATLRSSARADRRRAAGGLPVLRHDPRQHPHRPGRRHRRRSRRRRRRARLRERFDALPDGLDTEVRERGSRLSAGERQLVSLARAALADPAVLVLDEATSNLDPGTEHVVERALERLTEGRTVVVVAHRLSTAERADRVGRGRRRRARGARPARRARARTEGATRRCSRRGPPPARRPRTRRFLVDAATSRACRAGCDAVTGVQPSFLETVEDRGQRGDGAGVPEVQADDRARSRPRPACVAPPRRRRGRRSRTGRRRSRARSRSPLPPPRRAPPSGGAVRAVVGARRPEEARRATRRQRASTSRQRTISSSIASREQREERRVRVRVVRDLVTGVERVVGPTTGWRRASRRRRTRSSPRPRAASTSSSSVARSRSPSVWNVNATRSRGVRTAVDERGRRDAWRSRGRRGVRLARVAGAAGGSERERAGRKERAAREVADRLMRG